MKKKISSEPEYELSSDDDEETLHYNSKICHTN